jgi:cell division protein FtsL
MRRYSYPFLPRERKLNYRGTVPLVEGIFIFLGLVVLTLIALGYVFQNVEFINKHTLLTTLLLEREQMKEKIRCLELELLTLKTFSRVEKLAREKLNLISAPLVNINLLRLKN